MTSGRAIAAVGITISSGNISYHWGTWLGTDFAPRGGLVVCGVSLPQPECWDWRWRRVGYVLRFVPLARVPACLSTLHVLPATVPDLLARVQQYHPGEQMLLVLHANGDTGVYDLQRLAIAPEECYRQVQRRWSEFCLEPHQHGGFYGR